MSRYHDSHTKPKGPGDARPTALQIVKDEGLIGKLDDKVMLVTGTSSGIGIETVAALHATGATVFATARDMVKGQKVIDEILARDTSNKAEIHLVNMELDSLASVKRGAEEILGKTEKMNVVVCNAGVGLFFMASFLSPTITKLSLQTCTFQKMRTDAKISGHGNSLRQNR